MDLPCVAWMASRLALANSNRLNLLCRILLSCLHRKRRVRYLLSALGCCILHKRSSPLGVSQVLPLAWVQFDLCSRHGQVSLDCIAAKDLSKCIGHHSSRGRRSAARHKRCGLSESLLACQPASARVQKFHQSRKPTTLLSGTSLWNRCMPPERP